MYRGLFTLAERKQRQMQQELLSLCGPAPDGRNFFDISLAKPREVQSNNEEVVPWLHRGNLEGATGGLRRYSAAPGMMAQVAHGLSAGQSFSFVEVAGKQELPLVTAHSISTSQLPQDWQISTSVPALGANQMAFLLRVCSEDVAVLIGEWRGFKLPVVGVPGVSGTAGDRSTGRRGVQGRKGTKGKPGAAGRLHVQLFSLKSKSWCKARGTCSSPTLPSTFSIDLGPLGVHDCASTIEVNMATARLGGCKSSADCAVGYALALALAALHVALQPRMAPPQASKAVLGTASGQLPKIPVGASLYPAWTVEQRKFPLLTAAGGEMTPSTETVVGIPLGQQERQAQDEGYYMDDPFLWYGAGYIWYGGDGLGGGFHGHQSDYARPAQCGLSPEKRFSFYDHVHTTGMDLKQPLLCTAALTLSKDMTLRDYAQGAYRMRGIGRGQRIELLVTPEVRALMNKSLSQVEQTSEEARAASLQALRRKPEAFLQATLVDALCWLVLNGLNAEARKRQLLRQQDLHNIWRSAACRCLEIGTEDLALWLGKASVKMIRPPFQDTLEIAGWRAIEKEYLTGKTYVRFESDKVKNLSSVRKVFERYAEDTGFSADTLHGEYQALKAKEREEAKEENRKQREAQGRFDNEKRDQMIQLFRDRHGPLSGAMITSLPGWRGEAKYLPNSGQLCASYYDPSGRCFKLVKDIEAFFGFLIDSGQEDEIPDIEAAKSTMRVDEKGRPVNTARQENVVEEFTVAPQRKKRRYHQNVVDNELYKDSDLRCIDAGPSSEGIQEPEVKKQAKGIHKALLSRKFSKTTLLYLKGTSEIRGLSGFFYELPEKAFERKCYQKVTLVSGRLACGDAYIFWSAHRNGWKIGRFDDRKAGVALCVEDQASPLALTKPWKIYPKLSKEAGSS
ncbi:unnamed protein product [Effrenium voratum]|nr:unnamed protein product [Effrenium voratum]